MANEKVVFKCYIRENTLEKIARNGYTTMYDNFLKNKPKDGGTLIKVTIEKQEQQDDGGLKELLQGLD